MHIQTTLKTLLFSATGATLVAIGTSHPAQALSFSDNFNAENGGTGVLNYNSFANWEVVSGSGTVDLIGNGFFDFYPGQGLFVDLDGSTGNAGVFQTKTAFAFLPGYQYTLKFKLGGSQHGSFEAVNVDVGVAGIFNELFTRNSGDPLAEVVRTFTVASATAARLSFANAGGDNIGAILDDVSLSATAIPTPALLPGLLSMGLGLWRKRKAAPANAD